MDSSLLAVISLLVSIVGLIPLYVDLFHRRRARAISFSLQRFREPVSTPVQSEWSLRLLHPSRSIEKCMVFCDDAPLPWSYDGKLERHIAQGGGGIVRVPSSIETRDAKIVIKDGSRALKRTRFEKIPLVESRPVF
jgi:hypothetical protein